MALLQQGYAMDESGTQILDTYNKGLPYFELLGLIVKRLSSGFINYFFLLFYFKICSLIYHFWWYTFSFWRFLIFLCCSLFLLLCTWSSTCQALVIGSWTRYYHFFNIFFINLVRYHLSSLFIHDIDLVGNSTCWKKQYFICTKVAKTLHKDQSDTLSIDYY